ncbi:YitT family protein [Psychromonas sp. B3M02]|uniref:YitT family protein n=1 Tax=Psychromonas sp. B3M02 TaxID=2267226 RepID=UPI000DE96483|nr:YitT family protein [Psychromonas sp. B3M02]RBW46708.1 YitT family protein [Psychromonas sp. B3M02]
MPSNKHSFIEDVQAIIIATLLASLGVMLFKTTGLLIGGTAGLSFLGQYATQFSFSEIFFIINLPFYILSYKQLGWKFTLKTFVAVLLLSVFVEFTPTFITVSFLDPIYSAVVGGLLIGFGLLMLFRHGASLGGLMILAQFLNQKYKIPIGKFQMSVDFVVLLLAIFIVDWRAILLSILGATACNLILVINHKPGRYSGK